MARPDETAEFRRVLFGGLADDLFGSHAAPADHVRFRLGLRDRASERVKDAVALALGRLGLTKRPGSTDALAAALVQLVETAPELEHAYAVLDDAHSRSLFAELLRFRALGPRRVRLRRQSSAYWDAYRSVDARFLRERRTLEAGGRLLNLYELPGRDGPILLHGSRLTVLNTFVLEQYAFRRGPEEITVRPGDVAIDGGACWGETSLAFADVVGAAGRVHSFEFLPENIAVLQANLNLNPALAERIVLHRAALWSRAGETLEFAGTGPAATVRMGGRTGGSVPTASLDDLAEWSRVERIDFVKLDIEGAELDALAGASDSIARWRPRLAVATYHSHHDFMRIPSAVKELHPGYRLFLDHFTVHGEETILFARAGGEG